MTLNYDVAFSGSSGNAVRIENIIFDIGVPYKDIEYMFNEHNINAIFVSHEHPDHLNMATYNKIINEHPFIKIYGTSNALEKLKMNNYNVDNFQVTHDRQRINVHGTVVTIYEAKHEEGVTTNTYEVYLPNLYSYVFGTDFYDFKDLPQGKYDAFFIEANHDENYKEALIKQYGSLDEIPVWLQHSSDRHTTKQAALQFYAKHRINEKSIFEPLHKSSRFYDISIE